MTLPEIAVRRPVTILVTLISIIVIGGIAMSRLPLAFMPDNEEKRLFVIVNYNNASPKVIERIIARPLEEALTALPGLKRMNTRVGEGNARIMLFFDWSANLDMKRTEIRERIDRTLPELPDDLERILINDDWNPQESGDTIMEARLSSLRDLSKDYDLLERKIVRPLERLPGVASVLIDGVNPREIKINLKLNALKRHNLDARQIADVLRTNNENRTMGVVRDDRQRLTVRASGAFATIEEIENQPIPGTRLRLRDVAEITYEEPPLDAKRHLDGQFAIGVSITKESSANTVTVSNDVRRKVEELSSDPELGGISFLVWQDQGREIEKTIADLKGTGMFGAVLACIVLFLFLKRISATLIAVLCIPFSLIVALGVVWMQGKSLNTLTLLGLIVGVGMLVDNAVVVMENIVRYQQKGYSSRVSALIGSREVSVAVIAATLTSIIVFLPVIFSQPSEINILLRELGLTVCFTLIASLFVSQTLIPLATGWFIKNRGKKVKQVGPVMLFLQNRYEKILGFTLRHRWVTILVGLAVLGTLYQPLTKLDINFDNNENQTFVSMRYRFSEDLPIDKKEEVVTLVETMFDEYKEKLKVDSIYSYYSDRFTITRLYMQDGFGHEQHLNWVRSEVGPLLPKIAGVKLEVQDNGRFWQRNRGKRIGFQLLGPDTEVLSEYAEEAKARLETVPNLFDHYSTAEGGSTEIHTRIDRERAREYDVDIGSASQTVALTFRGLRLPRFKDDGKEIDMRLTLEEQEVTTLDYLKTLPMLDSEGVAPLESVADFAVVKGPDGINREDRVTNVWVGARYQDGERTEHIANAKAALADLELPYGYRWEFQAYRRDQQETQMEMFTNLILALGLIFAVMAGLFESIRQAVALTISLPFAFVGAAWCLYLTSTTFDLPAFVGLLLLLGIVVNNGIILIEHINMYRRDGMARYDAMLRGSRERLRPILMTAVTTLVGLLPMAVEKPSLGGVYYYSIAYVIMGGLLVSSVLTSLFLPATVCIIEDVLGWIGRMVAKAYNAVFNRGRREMAQAA